VHDHVHVLVLVRAPNTRCAGVPRRLQPGPDRAAPFIDAPAPTPRLRTQPRWPGAALGSSASCGRPRSPTRCRSPREWG